MSNENKTAKDIVAELEAKQQAGYLLRGEPEQYDDVTSSLYRATPLEAREYVSRIERDVVESCLYHCYTDTELQALKTEGKLQEHALRKLSEIQHFGGATNLIDFTKCHRRALFFACDRWPERDGRIVVIKPELIPAFNDDDSTNPNVLIPWGDREYIRRINGYPQARVEAQKSVFVHAKNGILNRDDYEVISIPSCLKTDIREWLAVDLRINRRSIYPDTIGFVDANRHQHSIKFMLKAEKKLENSDYKGVIKLCGKSTNEQAYSYVYHIWGIALLQLGETQEAIDKFDRALKIDSWRDKASGNKDITNGAWVATLTAKNIAEGIHGEYPTPYAIFSLNHRLGKGRPLPRESGMFTMPHILYTPAPDSLEYQSKRWHVLNLFYDYNELWNALPQLDEGKQYAFALAEQYAKHREQHGELNEHQDVVFFTEKTRFLSPEQRHKLNVDENFSFYLRCCRLDRKFYRKFLCDELENPLK